MRLRVVFIICCLCMGTKVYSVGNVRAKLLMRFGLQKIKKGGVGLLYGTRDYLVGWWKDYKQNQVVVRQTDEKWLKRSLSLVRRGLYEFLWGARDFLFGWWDSYKKSARSTMITLSEAELIMIKKVGEVS